MDILWIYILFSLWLLLSINDDDDDDDDIAT